jgi:hypothetical protein
MPDRRQALALLALALSLSSTPVHAQQDGAASPPKPHRWLDWQVLAGKRLSRVSVSGDWTSLQSVTTFREAAPVTTNAWAPPFSIAVYYGAAVHNGFPVPQKQRLDVVASWNVLKAVQRAGVW